LATASGDRFDRTTRQAPCVLDVFLSVTDYVNGGDAKPWWAYTALRKSRYGELLDPPGLGERSGGR
jgi:hypothetical protein